MTTLQLVLAWKWIWQC